MQAVFFILILAVLVFAVYLLVRKVSQKNGDDFSGDLFGAQQIKQRGRALEKIQKLARQKDRIAAGDVQALLNIPETTANRYLEYLVNLGKLKQINERGQGVYYELSN